MIEQVIDVTEWAMPVLAAIIAGWAMIRLTANVTKFLYTKFESQGYVCSLATTRSVISWLCFTFM